MDLILIGLQVIALIGIESLFFPEILVFGEKYINTGQPKNNL